VSERSDPPPASGRGSIGEEPSGKDAFTSALSKLWGWCRSRPGGLKARLLGGLRRRKEAVTRSKRARVGLIIGGASAVVVVGLVLFLVLFLRPVFVVAAVETDDAVVSGEDILLSVDLANQGRTSGEYELRVLVDGEAVETEVVTLDGGTREQVPVSLSGLPPGRYAIALAEWPESAQEVWVMTPADFEIDRIKVQPRRIDLATTTEAEVLVGLTNTGEAKGSYELEVALDGELVEVREIELEGGSHAEETFTLTVGKPGSHEVAVNDERTELEVYRIERPENGTKLVSQRSGGPNCLKITNNLDKDGVVVLSSAGESELAQLAAYVRAHSTHTVERVKDGTYLCYYAFGEEWCSYRKKFTRIWDRGRFVEPMEVESPGWSYTEITLEFGPASEESSPTEEESSPTTEDVGLDDFPDISRVVNSPTAPPPQSTAVPEARLFHQMVYDAFSGQVILFGGMVQPSILGDEQLDDTWSYDPEAGTWTLLQLLGDVSLGRGHSSLVYDLRSGKVILFGGISSLKKPLNDTWAYDRAANTWTNLRPSGRVPSQRSDHAMVYDSSTGKVVLFGGYDGGFLDDTWAYDPAANTWTELKPSGGAPEGRSRHSMVYDPVSRKVIMFGGAVKMYHWSEELQLNNLWAYDPAANTWTRLRPSGETPPGRYGQCLVYDPVSAKVILFGGDRPWVDSAGRTTTRPLDDLWAYDPVANTWTELKPSGDLPPGRAYSSLVYVYAVGKIVLFGGSYGSIVLNQAIALNDTWAYDPITNAWTELHPCDPPLGAAASAVDSEGGRALERQEIGSIISRTLWQQALPLPSSIVPSIH
jgi:N-acetylneuraminic acid mutarotase